jgi:O-acetyl-ADP-ribose deacetylase (regulator of RNase III)
MRFTTGNILDAETEALVNTVNTVGVMGKGIALMFKEAYKENFRQYAAACKRREVKVGSVFVFELPTTLTGGPRWILNFPTKEHWRSSTRIEWIEEGLKDLRRVIETRGIRSVAIPPLGCGHGGLRWQVVKPLIESALGDLEGVDVVVYEPTRKYLGKTMRYGVEKLTPARALVAELVRRYWLLGIRCSILEIQKLAYFLDRSIRELGLPDPLNAAFKPDKYGPYADEVRHLLDNLDGSYLHCEKRVSDATPWDTISFDERKTDRVSAYLKSEGKAYLPALERTSQLIDGFESPLGMELLATVDWLIQQEGCAPTVDAVRDGLRRWPDNAGQRKQGLFDDRMLGLAIERLTESHHAATANEATTCNDCSSRVPE